ncbi:MAG: hypothetical protein HY455_03295 [Parcubacteria group bacterium]|nr:hypothetical protein [Parcubacteria group bacterium]
MNKYFADLWRSRHKYFADLARVWRPSGKASVAALANLFDPWRLAKSVFWLIGALATSIVKTIFFSAKLALRMY